MPLLAPDVREQWVDKRILIQKVETINQMD